MHGRVTRISRVKSGTAIKLSKQDREIFGACSTTDFDSIFNTYSRPDRDSCPPSRTSKSGLRGGDLGGSYIFGIEKEELSALVDEEERAKYISDHLLKKFKVDMAEFAKRQQIKKDRNRINRSQNQDEASDSADVFHWLKVGCRFKGLRNKLRQKLVEIITDETVFKDFELDLRKIRQDEDDSFDIEFKQLKSIFDLTP